MKRVGYLCEEATSLENISKAYRNALRRKQSHPSEFTLQLLENRDAVINAIKFLLDSGAFTPSQPHCFQVVDGISNKIRDVQAPVIYPDQIIHWAYIQAIEPIFMKSMYAHSCGSIPGRGGAHVRKYLEKKLRAPDGRTKYKYCLKMDIHHFFESVNQEILIGLLRRKIKDEKFIGNLADIIRSCKKGLPIGYYTSQWFANFYLERFDHFVKEDLHADVYVRYIDDIVICGSNKRKLHRIREGIMQYLSEQLDLEIKNNWQIFKIAKRGIDFVGFRFYHDRTGIRKGILRNIVRANRQVKEPATKRALTSMISYYGWLNQTDTYIFAQKHLKGSKQDCIRRFKILDKANVNSERELYRLKEVD